MTKMYRIGDNEWVGMRHGFMAFIHVVNQVCDENGEERIFGEPTELGDWWVPGLYAEQYPKANVIYTKGTHEERVKRGEGYRMVLLDDDLAYIWEEAWRRVEPLLETKHDLPRVTKMEVRL